MSLIWTRVLLVASSAVLATLAALILALLTVPYSPHPTLTYLNCSTPCFMGIRPGLTDINDAIDQLEAEDWVGHVGAAGFESGVEFFTWNGQRADIMESWEWASLGAENNIVRSLIVPTRMRLGDLIAAYGQIDSWSLNGEEAFASFYRHGFAARFPLHIQRFESMKRFLWSPVTLHFIRTE